VQRWSCKPVLLALVAGPTAWAQGAATVPASSEPQRIEIQGRAESTDARREATVAMTVVGREELDEFGDTSLLDVLQRLPGITLDGEQPRLLGMGAGYTLILLNGEPAPPGFSLDRLSPAEIERVEIIKGPTAEYSGVAGTINIILRTPPRLRQLEWRGNVNHRGLSAAPSTQFSWGDRIGALGFQLPISAYRWSGLGTGFTVRSSQAANGALSASRVESRDESGGHGINLGPRLDWRISELEGLQWQNFLQSNESQNVSTSRTQWQAGTPGSIAAGDSRNRSRWELARTQLQWHRRTPEGQRWELRGSLQRNLGRSSGLYQGQDIQGAPVLLRDSRNHSDDRRGSAAARYRTPWAEGHVLALGVDLERRERSELRQVVENGVELRTTSIGSTFNAAMNRQVMFIQDDWTLSPRTAAALGLRAEAVRTLADSTVGPVAQRSTQLSPVLNLRHALDASGRDVLRLGLARSSRLPDLSSLMGRYTLNTTYERTVTNTALAADSAGNPRLLPERAWALDLGAESYLPGGAVLSVSAFARRIEGLIRRRTALELVPEATAPRWVSRPSNIGSAHSRGLTLEVKGRGEQWFPGWFEPRSGWNVRASASAYRSRVEQIDDPDARLEGQPPWSATLGFDRNRPRDALSFGANLALTPAYSIQQTDLQRIWRSRAMRLDAFLLWRFSRDVQLRLSAQQIAAPDPQSRSTAVDEAGGFSSSQTRRDGRTGFSLNLLVRM
jgi:outer membrane receptor for ferrienterochelin and colicins